jgi:uncharacterized protein (DUF1778 family)
MANPTSATSILSVPVNADECAILEASAQQARTSLSDFVRCKAVEAARAEVFKRTVVTVPPKDWAAFEAWVNRPAEVIPALKKLARVIPSWEG